MRAMRAREVTPEEAPELHGMIDRLCALADMPKPRVGIADMAVPNAFATGRSPDRAGGVRDHRDPAGCCDAEELEAVLAHELSHVAHRDVLVMTVASSAGIAAGLLMRFAQFGGMGRSRNNNSACPAVLAALLGQPGGLRRQLPAAAAALALPRAQRRPRRRLPHPQARGAGLARCRRSAARGPPRPQRDLRAAQRGQRTVHRPGPARWGLGGLMATHPPLQQRLEQLARIQAELSRPTG